MSDHPTPRRVAVLPVIHKSSGGSDGSTSDTVRDSTFKSNVEPHPTTSSSSSSGTDMYDMVLHTLCLLDTYPRGSYATYIHSYAAAVRVQIQRMWDMRYQTVPADPSPAEQAGKEEAGSALEKTSREDEGWKKVSALEAFDYGNVLYPLVQVPRQYEPDSSMRAFVPLPLSWFDGMRLNDPFRDCSRMLPSNASGTEKQRASFAARDPMQQLWHSENEGIFTSEASEMRRQAILSAQLRVQAKKEERGRQRERDRIGSLPEPMVWILSTTTACHITNRRDVLAEYRPFSTQKKIRCSPFCDPGAMEEEMESPGEGRVDLACMSPSIWPSNPWANGNSGPRTSDTTTPAGVNATSQIPGTAEMNTSGEDGGNATHGTIVLTLENVLYAPTAKVNVLSVHALPGVRWEFDSLAAHGTVEGLREVRGMWVPEDPRKVQGWEGGAYRLLLAEEEVRGQGQAQGGGRQGQQREIGMGGGTSGVGLGI